MPVKGPSIGLAGRLTGLEIWGSIGPITYDRNQYSQYARHRTIPIDPKTPRQLAQRDKMALAVSDWHALFDAQRAVWNELARGKPLTGFNLYVQAHMTAP